MDQNQKISPGSGGHIFCRICHEGDLNEKLVSPCDCTGSLALIHMNCLEHWLTTSNHSHCEICQFKYKTEKQPRPCTEYISDSTNKFNVRNLIADIICFFLLTPLLVVSTYLCVLGANQYLMKERWEAIGLILLSLFLLAVYFTWCHVTTRFHITVFCEWQRSHQIVRLTNFERRSESEDSFNAQGSQEQLHSNSNTYSPLIINNLLAGEQSEIVQNNHNLNNTNINTNINTRFNSPAADTSSSDDSTIIDLDGFGNESETRQIIK